MICFRCTDNAVPEQRKFWEFPFFESIVQTMFMKSECFSRQVRIIVAQDWRSEETVHILLAMYLGVPTSCFPIMFNMFQILYYTITRRQKPGTVELFLGNGYTRKYICGCQKQDTKNRVVIWTLPAESTSSKLSRANAADMS
jgi:hypothetical protein